jgi:NAD(P)-dependent dehydrogenase (short-subunit alcohol dehydrogenase family)
MMMSTSNDREHRAEFSGRTVLITGGGTGMGRAAALRFAARGANVVIAGRRVHELDAGVSEIAASDGSAFAVPADVSSPSEVERLVASTIDKFGALHMAWNNAGVLGSFLPLHEMSFQAFDALMSINLRGVFACMKHELAAMLELGIAGSIVNTSSWTAHGAMPGTAAYAASKAALDALMRNAALEVGPRGINESRSQ